jgi:hypothetical protein
MIYRFFFGGAGVSPAKLRRRDACTTKTQAFAGRSFSRNA